MSKESSPDLEETFDRLDRAYLRSLKKPIAIGAIGLSSILAGNYIDGTHQEHADELGEQVDDAYEGLGESERQQVDAFLQGEDLPAGADDELIKTAERIDRLEDEHRKEEDAGELWKLGGGAALLYGGFKGIGLMLGRGLDRHKIKETHPELAPSRIQANSPNLVRYGRWLDQNENYSERLGFEGSREDTYLRGYLTEVGIDIEASVEFELQENALKDALCKMLLDAQVTEMIGGSAEDSDEKWVNLDESLKIRVVDDLWKPTDTFRSLKDWYGHMRRQYVKPHEVRTVRPDQLFLPGIDTRPGGIGVAIGRISSYREQAPVIAQKSIEVLDQIAPQTDGTSWAEYVDKLPARQPDSSEV